MAALEAAGEDPQLSKGAVHRYAAAVSMAAVLERAWRAAGCPGTVVGPRGKEVEHPLVRALGRARGEAADLGDRLGLSPAARRRMGHGVGRPPGAASAPDRTPRVPRRTTRKVVPLPLREDSDA
jgi:hypothetical protein